VHPNGRINYAGQPNTFADGSDASARRELEAQEQLREVHLWLIDKRGTTNKMNA
jgi:hypothetical protein